jgi:hypothetical protein
MKKVHEYEYEYEYEIKKDRELEETHMMKSEMAYLVHICELHFFNALII